jgi:hypothetical protein
MTRKDYILIAAALKAAADYTKRFPDQPADTFVTAVHTLADALARDNPRFDRERFLKAAGMQS